MSEALKFLAKTLEADIVEEQEDLASGAASDWPDYKRREGRVQGLRKALSRIDEIQDHIRKTGGLDDDEA